MNYKMDAELKEKWVEALRSGKYDQADGVLRKRDWHVETQRPGNFTNSFCCLGVLADVIDPTGWVVFNRTGSTALRPHVLSSSGSRGPDMLNMKVLPKAVQEPLAQMNDDGEGFDTIANWIEQNL